MNREPITVDVSLALRCAVGEGGVAPEELDALVARGREIHDDLLLARARGQIGFADLYMLGREAMRARDAAETLASRFEDVAVLAHAAEADVAAAVLQSLVHPFHNLLPKSGRAGRPRVFLVDSIDPDWLGAFLESFAVEQTLLITLAKSGGGLGALVQYAIVRDMLRKRLGPGYQDHLAVVTDPMAGSLREETLREGILSFEVPANVTARYSALTPVALLPAAMAGVDVRAVLGGAHTAAEATAGEDLRTNPAYLLASVLHLLATEHGRADQMVVAGSPMLGATALQVARMLDESRVGHAPAADGRHASNTAGFAMPSDASSLLRRCRNGAADTAVVLLEVEKHGRDRVLPVGAPGVDWLAGRHLGEVAEAERAALRRLLGEAGVPIVSVRLPSLEPAAVGAFHMTIMLAAAFGARLGGVTEPLPSEVDAIRKAVRDELAPPAAAGD